MSSITSVRDPGDHLQEIVSRIYLGDAEAFNKETIAQKKITYVLSLGDFSNDLELPVEYKASTTMALQSLGSSYEKKIP